MGPASNPREERTAKSKGLEYLVEPHLHSRCNVARALHDQFRGEPVVGRPRMVDSQIERNARGARGETDRAKLLRKTCLQSSSFSKAILQAGMFGIDGTQLGDRILDDRILFK